MQICDQVSKPLMSARISATGRKPHSMISASRGRTAGRCDVEEVDHAQVDAARLRSGRR